MPMNHYKSCRYTAFISYAHRDDERFNHWVTCFSEELAVAIGSGLRDKVHPIHLSSKNGPMNGSLDAGLRENIAASFFTILVVHDAYVESGWCRREIEIFREVFGTEGLEKRLFIVAMSKTAMERLLEDETVSQHILDDQTWKRFFSNSAPDIPLEIYQGKPPLQANEFHREFRPLGDYLVDRLRENVRESPNAFAFQAARTPARPQKQDAAPPATEAPKQRSAIIGVTTSDIEKVTEALAVTLADGGAKVRQLDRDALMSGLGTLRDADCLILPFSHCEPLMPNLEGGHLAFQRDAWLGFGKPDSALVWVDMRSASTVESAAMKHRQFLKDCSARAVTPAQQVSRSAAEHQHVPSDAVRIYIEDNKPERRLWETLGEQLKRKWDEIGGQLKPPLYVRPRALPIDNIDQHPHLNDADGIVLLWGKKTSESLVSHIGKVEGKLSGRDIAPGIVAYLMPPQQDPRQPMPAWGWPVLRFEASNLQEIDVVNDEADELKDFLQKILRHTRRRRGCDGAPGSFPF
jgi:hypothetical protein